MHKNDFINLNKNKMEGLQQLSSQEEQKLRDSFEWKDAWVDRADVPATSQLSAPVQQQVADVTQRMQAASWDWTSGFKALTDAEFDAPIDLDWAYAPRADWIISWGPQYAQTQAWSFDSYKTPASTPKWADSWSFDSYSKSPSWDTQKQQPAMSWSKWSDAWTDKKESASSDVSELLAKAKNSKSQPDQMAALNALWKYLVENPNATLPWVDMSKDTQNYLGMMREWRKGNAILMFQQALRTDITKAKI